MKKLLWYTVVLFFLSRAANVYAGFYPSVGSDVSFTDQNETFYTLYASLGYTPTYKTFLSIGYSHEWNYFTQATQEYHILYANIYQKINRRYKLGIVLNSTFGATPNTDGYYALSSKLDSRYALTDKVSLSAGPVYYYIYGPGGFIGIFFGAYFYPVYDWLVDIKGSADTSIDAGVSQQDTSLELGTSYTINRYIGFYALYRLSTGITTNPTNALYTGNSSGTSTGKGGIGTMAMGDTMNNPMGGSGASNYLTTTISIFTIGLSVTF